MSELQLKREITCNAYIVDGTMTATIALRMTKSRNEKQRDETISQNDGTSRIKKRLVGPRNVVFFAEVPLVL